MVPSELIVHQLRFQPNDSNNKKKVIHAKMSIKLRLSFLQK